DRPVGELSAGQRRRLALARLLPVARPLWLLDEPFTALDTQGREVLTRLVGAHLALNGMVIASSHEALPFATQTITLPAPQGSV
ncbi:MAG: ATP-binding cassette domain-containing protein, partial [Alphaproteobacteria bacterium]|nr:ATP-binding cassette domain-containing protein [Alphaproteobacteria bacterium]